MVKVSDFLKEMAVSYGRRHGKSKVLQEYIAKYGHKTKTITTTLPPTSSPTSREQFEKLWRGTPEKMSFPGLAQMTQDVRSASSNSSDAMTMEKLKKTRENMVASMNVGMTDDETFQTTWTPGLSIPSADGRTEKDKKLAQENGELRAENERLKRRIAALEEQLALEGDW